MSTLNSRLQLSILNRKKGKNLLEKGFTLVELMIVIVVVGVLSAVALPNFLGVKDKAEAGSQVGELLGLAKECSTAIIIDGPYPDAYPTTVNASGNCYGTAQTDTPSADVVFTGEEIPTGSAATAKCGPDVAKVIAAGEKCIVTVKQGSGKIEFSKA